MATSQGGSAIASFGLGYAIAAITIAIIDALEAFIPSFSDWLMDTFASPWLHLGVLGILIFLVIGFAGIGRQLDSRRTALLVGGSMVVSGLWIFTSTMILALRGGM